MTFPGFGGQGPTILAITWTECAVALALYILRAYTASLAPRGSTVSNLFGLRWDFAVVSFATVLACTAQAFLTVSVLHGTGNHQSTLTVDEIVAANLWSWTAQIIAILAATTGRIAVILFLLYIQTQVKRHLKWILYCVGAATTAINLIEIGLILRQCQPVAGLWDIRIKSDCSFIPITTNVGYLQGGIGAVADFVLALYPILIIGPLQQMRWVMKIGLCVVMAGGLVAGTAAINKTIAIGSITKTTDISYATWSLLTWVWTEMWLIIILGSIPPLWQLFKKLTMKAKGLITYQSQSGSKSSPNDTGLNFTKRSSSKRFGDPRTKIMYNFQLKNLSEPGSASNYRDDTAESEEEILPGDNTHGPLSDHILVTQEVCIQSESDVFAHA